MGKEDNTNEKVFISYADDDIEAARQLYSALKDRGLSPWLAGESLLPGQRVKDVIEKEITESDYVVLLLSENSVSKRGHFQKQVRLAMEVLDEYPESFIFLIPVRITPCEITSHRLKEYQAVDLFPSWDKGFEKILRALRYKVSNGNQTSAKRDYGSLAGSMQDSTKETGESRFQGSSNEVNRILVLSANPLSRRKLGLDQEIRDIGEGLRRSKNRDRFDFKPVPAVRVRDFRRAMLDYDPHIVHFSGHGDSGGIKVLDEMGHPVRLSNLSLSGLFELFADQVKCVLLNSCYSEVQAKAISEHIPYVIGMNEEIRDQSSHEFSIGFYDALGAGKSVEKAFQFGTNAIMMMYPELSDHQRPVLLKKG